MQVRLNLYRPALVVVMCAVGCGFSQSQSTVPKFHAKAELVAVPTLVQNAGRHVPDLRTSDFTIFIDGHIADVASVDEIRENKSTKVVTRSDGENIFSNVAASLTNGKAPIVFVLDTIHTNALAQQLARDAVLKFLDEQVRLNIPVAMMAIHYDSIKVISGFSTDPVAFRTAIAGGHSGRKRLEIGQTGPMRDQSEVEPAARITDEIAVAFDTYRNLPNDLAIKQSLTGLRQVAAILSGVPGRKTVIWMNSGFEYFRMFSPPIGRDGSVLSSGRRSQFSSNLHAEFERTVRALSSAGAAVYPIQVTSDNRDWSYFGPEHSGHASEHRTQAEAAHNNTIDNLIAIASATGGTATYGTMNVVPAMQRASEESQSYYLITFDPRPLQLKPGWHDIKVNLRARKASVRHRPGLFLGTEGSEVESEMRLAASAPVEFSGIPLRARWVKTAQDPTFELIAKGSAITLGPTNNFDLELYLTVTNEAGAPVTQRRMSYSDNLTPEKLGKFLQTGAVLSGSIKVPAGRFRARFILLDRVAGKVGSIFTSIDIPNRALP